MPNPSTSDIRPIEQHISLSFLAKALFVLSFVVIVIINTFNLNQPIVELHDINRVMTFGFRQTQTALTSYYLKQDGFSFNYETPVVGEPWSIPFEFPIYQEIVAKTADILNAPLTNTGKLVSLLFSLLTCIPIYFSLVRLNIDKKAIYLSMALYLSSPIYLFWAGSFMIESTALFFTCSALYYAIRITLKDFQNSNFILLSAFLTLALLQKITTPLPCLMVFAALFAFILLRTKYFSAQLIPLVKLIISIIIPVLIAYIWVKHTDVVKAENPIGRIFTSAALRDWNYGSIDQRFSSTLWLHLIFKENIVKCGFLVFGLLSIFMTGFLCIEKNIKATVIISFLCFIVPFVVFTHLHLVHNYYQNANAIFLNIAIGISVVYLCDRYLKKQTLLYSLVLILFMLSNYVFFYRDYFPQKQTVVGNDNRILALAEFLKTHTPKDKPVICLGLDWSSELPLYSERKMLAVPERSSPDVDVDALENTAKYLSTTPSAIVLCPSIHNNEDAVRATIAKTYSIAEVTKISNCEIYTVGSKL